MNNIPYKFHFKFSAPIWKSEISKTGQTMAFEIRNDEAHQTSFYVLDAVNFSWLLTDAVLEEGWWCGLTELDDTVLTVHVYENEESPEQKSYFEIDFVDTNDEQESTGHNIEVEISSPVHYSQENEYFKEFEEFILTELNLKPELGCDYLEYNENIIISTYVRSDNGIDCILVLVNSEGEIMLFEKMEQQLSGIVGKPYFIVGDNLFFVKNKSEICVYDLT